MMDVESIPEYFSGKEIFITGGSGFIGKVLVEKLLRSCPDLKTIYLLLRSKKNCKPEERVKALMSEELFDTVRKMNPEALDKVIGIAGDVSELKLGMSEQDRSRVLGVNVVFHVAASVRFDDPLKKATLMNTRGTREVMELMLEMSCLEVGVHVSTTYCNTDKDRIEERVYRDHGDWKEAIRVAEEFEDDYKIACLTEKMLGGLTNTYLLTKHLGENVAEDYSDRLPLVLFRPGIVVSMWKDPIPGWADNVNGPIGLNVAAGKGFLRAVHCNPDCRVDNMPVDVVVRSLIISAWKKGVELDTEPFPVYNSSMEGKFFETQKEVRDESLIMISKYPYNGMVWYPCCEFIKNKTLFRIKFLLYNVTMALLADYVLLPLVGRKPMLCKLTRKAYYAMDSVSCFMARNWEFRSQKYWGLNDYLKDCDKKDFEVYMQRLNLYEFMINARMGTSKYVLKENIDIPAAQKSYRLLQILHYMVKYLIIGSVIYFLLTRRYFGETVEGVMKNIAI